MHLSVFERPHPPQESYARLGPHDLTTYLRYTSVFPFQKQCERLTRQRQRSPLIDRPRNAAARRDTEQHPSIPVFCFPFHRLENHNRYNASKSVHRPDSPIDDFWNYVCMCVCMCAYSTCAYIRQSSESSLRMHDTCMYVCMYPWPNFEARFSR